METINPSGNGGIELTPLTDDELKEVNEKIEHVRLLPVREILKDTLNIIHLTVKHFLRHNIPGESKYIDVKNLMADSWNQIISNVKSQVDEMDDKELAKIAKHANYVQDAFELVKMYLPAGMYQCMHQVPGFDAHIAARKLEGYLRKVFDIYCILNTPVEQYLGADIEYFAIVQCRGAKRHAPENPEHEIYSTRLPYSCFVPTPIDSIINPQIDKPIGTIVMDTLTIMEWAERNLKNCDKHEFCEFAIRHKSKIRSYVLSKSLYPTLTEGEKDEICKLVYKWFLRNQESE